MAGVRAWEKSHYLYDLVVLLEGDTPIINLNSDCHHNLQAVRALSDFSQYRAVGAVADPRVLPERSRF